MNTAGFLSIPASIAPEQEAVVSGSDRFTYAETLARVRRLAGALARLGVGAGTRVAALDTNSHRYLEAYYATATLGGVFIPLNYRAKRPELAHMLTTSEASVLFVGHRYLEHVEALRPALGGLATVIGFDGPAGAHPGYEALLAGAGEHEDEADVDDQATTILMYTSGTTALPKGVLLTFHDFTAYVTANVELADGTPRGAALLCVPLYHIAGATNMMTTLWTGRRLVLMPQFEPRAWLDLVERERVSHAFVVPTMLKQLLDQPDLERRDLSSLEILSYGGAAMPFPVIRRAIERFPKTVGFVNAFGQTETTSTLTVLGPEDHRLEGTPAEVERRMRRLASLGRPLPDVEIRIVDDDDRPLPPGQVGEIHVRTPRVMKGYAGSRESPLVGDGWLPTRDMGWVDDDGYVYIAGRKDDMIIRGGENIAPAEVEAVLQSHPAVEEAAVVGVPDIEWGQRVAAFVVLRDGERLAAEALGEFCRERLASFKKPEIIRFLPELPKNPMGKILRRDLRAQLDAT
ncbi:MAG TPA: long-chain-fatty-acid--CoA ligase [Candidatus Binatia bacterium]|nr:long-chain-fatty-acid--CoA ligase [Candidatus Binatia bacterium]